MASTNTKSVRSKGKEVGEFEDATALDALAVKRLTLIGKRDAIFARLQQIYNCSLNAFTDDTEKDLFLCGIISLDRLQSEFNDIVNDLNVTELTIDPTYSVSYQSINVFEDMYCRCKFVYNKLNPPAMNVKGTESHVTPQHKSVKLPKLELMTFDGNPMTWKIFHESFRRTIHENADLTDHERIQYLVNKLSGRALSVISGIVPNADNYHLIWSTLVNKYDDQRSLGSAYLDQLLDFKPTSITASAKNLELFLDKFCTAVSSLHSLKLDNLSDFMLLQLALKKIDSSTARSFEMHMRGISMPTYDDLIKFVREQSKILERTAPASRNSDVNNNKQVVPKSTHSFAASCASQCPLCNQSDHANLYRCPAFNKLSTEDRLSCIKQHKGCTNCLSVSHNYTACNSPYSCRHCGCKHHSMLCRKMLPSREGTRTLNRAAVASSARNPAPAQSSRARADNAAGAAARAPLPSAPPAVTAHCPLADVPKPPAYQSQQQNISLCNNVRPVTQPTADTTCLLGTVQVYATDSNGRKHVVRALIDSASQSNFISANCCAKLNLKCNKVTNTVVKGIGSASNPIKGVISTTLHSRLDNNFISVDAFVIDRITDNLPSVRVDTSCLAYLHGLPLADKDFSEPSEIEILIGAPLFADILLSGRAAGPPGAPTAFESIFGFIVIGTAPVATAQTYIAFNDDSHRSRISLCAFAEQPRLDNILQKFWQLEEVQCTPALSPTALENERIFTNNFSRDSTGRYCVALPFSRDPAAALGNSFLTAKKRFMHLERKLVASPPLRVEYDAIIQEYLQKGYVSLINNDDSLAGYYIPHHAIARLDKTTTKWRMVMDASAKTDSSLSLNDVLHTGDNLQNDLFVILLEFRFYAIVFTSDIKQMYLQVLVNEESRKFQKFLYRFDLASPLSTYVFNRVCFGLRSSPFLAMRVLRQLCADERARFPHAASVIENNTYMDDVCYSMPSMPGSVQLRDDLRELLKAGGFELVKWASNVPELTESLPVSDRHSAVINFDEPDSNLKVLGLQWLPSSDAFMFTVNVESRPATKRNMLSVIARQYDVLGLIAPVILYAKLILQKLHVLKLDWDEQPPQAVVDIWHNYLRELPAIQQMRFPRHLGVEENSKITVVAFSDASEHGYGSVVYIRTQSDHDSTPLTRLVCAKSKVSPLKTISIAKLELCGCLLMSKLVRRVLDTYEKRHTIDKVYCFTDSMVALQWITASPHRFKTFVATRITKITSAIPVDSFRHIPGTENPCADALSRGLSPAQLVNHPLWLTGPDWLSQEPAAWPAKLIAPAKVDLNLPESKKIVSLPVTQPAVENSNPLLKLSTRVSSWLMLLRIAVRIYRFIKKLPRSKYFTADEMNFAEIQVLKAVQRHYFADIIQNLKNNSRCSNAIQRLVPFLDADGLIRVGGRLRNADLSYNQQHPILLPRKDRIIEMIIEHYHRHNCHTGPHALMSILRQRYWILASRNIVRSVIHKCNYCFKAKPKPTFPIMGDLPACRVNEFKAFTHTAVDYAGPISIIPIRKRGVRSIKAYLCIFVCMSVRSVSVELTTDLSSCSFLSAFKRFLARRGTVSVLYSDNARTFIGARNALSDVYKLVSSEEYNKSLSDELSANRITWKFNPPRSPHFGGNYEIFVKAFKGHLAKTIGSQLLTYEEMLTVLTQIESVINSRPLTLLSEDPSEPTALTPAHFLMAAPLKHLPACAISDEPAHLLKRYSLLDKMIQSFSKRWKLEYLHLLQSRGKWNTLSNPIKVGSVVLIITDNLPPLSWPLGVVEETILGADGICRVCLVRTATSVYKRPVVRLCILPTQ